MRRWLLLLMIPAMAYSSITPKDIERDINEYGAKEFSEKIPKSYWTETLNNISAGKGEWIALAPKLAPVINREQARGLNGALFYAIEPNAGDVLSVLAILDKHKYPYPVGSDFTCSSEELLSTDVIKKHYDGIRGALLNVGPQGADCLWLFEGLVAELKANK